MLFVFIVANIPLPVIIVMNCRVWYRAIEVVWLGRHIRVRRPKSVKVGWWLGNVSTFFAFLPNIWERRIFVENHWWLISYAIAATLSITGLTLMEKGLGKELRSIKRRRAKAHA